MKSQTIAVVLLVAICLAVIACERSSQVPITGQVNLTYVSSTETELRLQLANQTAENISFRGGKEFFTDHYPWDTRIECWDAKASDWNEVQSSMPHANSKTFNVAPGTRLFVVVGYERAKENLGAVQRDRCKLGMYVRGVPKSTLYSNEFEL